MKKSRLLGTVVSLFAAGSLLIGCDMYTNRNEQKQSKNKNIITQYVLPSKTYIEYGKNIVYFDFSELPGDLIQEEKIKLPSDLAKYLTGCKPKIKDRKRFEKEFWEEAFKLGYTIDKFEEFGIKEAIQAVVEITASRFTYSEVDDKENWFAKKYGNFLPTDEYFHHGLGDCDKYRDATIATFEIIKKLNPKLEHVYLSREELGGSMERHAWVSIIMPKKDFLLLSHIDPTFYDDNGELEASKNKFDSHILVCNDAFKAYFYHYLCNYEYAYNLFEESILKTENEETIEKLLDDMGHSVFLLSDKKRAAEKIEWVRQQYEYKGFKDNLDDLLYYSYNIYQKAGDKKKAGVYLQRLLEEFPKSYWNKVVK